MGVTGGNGDAVRGELAQGGRPWDLQVMEGVPLVCSGESQRDGGRGGAAKRGGRQRRRKRTA